MTAVSMNRSDLSLKSVQGDAIRSCITTADDKSSHFEIKSVVMPLRSTANLSGSTCHRSGSDSNSGGSSSSGFGVGGGNGGDGGSGGVNGNNANADQMTTTTSLSSSSSTTTTNRQPIGSTAHSYSSDSDIVPNTTAATSSATAMRRLYFKSAKLNKTTSITTVHQQQSQHVPKVKWREIRRSKIFKDIRHYHRRATF